ncbi:3817_t:CDS:1, partial [Dentiscutata heterogama]
MQDKTSYMDMNNIIQNNIDKIKQARISKTTIWRKKQKKANTLSYSNQLVTLPYQPSPVYTIASLFKPLLTNIISLVSRSLSKSLPIAIRNSLETMKKLQIYLGQSINIETPLSVTNNQSIHILLPLLLQLSPIHVLLPPLLQLPSIHIYNSLSNKVAKLQMCLDEVTQQCLITKSSN